MVTRGICIRGLPKYIWEAIVGKGLGCKTTIYIQRYRLIARYFICSSHHLHKEPCCCITMCCKHTPSIVIWFVRATFSSLHLHPPLAASDDSCPQHAQQDSNEEEYASDSALGGRVKGATHQGCILRKLHLLPGAMM